MEVTNRLEVSEECFPEQIDDEFCHSGNKVKDGAGEKGFSKAIDAIMPIRVFLIWQ
jgi:hypothetical protein